MKARLAFKDYNWDTLISLKSKEKVNIRMKGPSKNHLWSILDDVI